MAQLMQLLAGGGQMSPELLLMHPQLLQQLLGKLLQNLVHTIIDEILK